MSNIACISVITYDSLQTRSIEIKAIPKLNGWELKWYHVSGHGRFRTENTLFVDLTFEDVISKICLYISGVCNPNDGDTTTYRVWTQRKKDPVVLYIHMYLHSLIELNSRLRELEFQKKCEKI